MRLVNSVADFDIFDHYELHFLMVIISAESDCGQANTIGEMSILMTIVNTDNFQ